MDAQDETSKALGSGANTTQLDEATAPERPNVVISHTTARDEEPSDSSVVFSNQQHSEGSFRAQAPKGEDGCRQLIAGNPNSGQSEATKSVVEPGSARQSWDSKSINDRQTGSKPDEDDRWTQLHAAVEAGDEELVQKLLRRGHSSEDAASDGRKPLLIAAERGFVNIVELLASRASVESLNESDHSTALTRACEESHNAVVKALVDLGANIEAKGRDGRTPLLIAISLRNHDMVKYLLQHGADQTVTLEDGLSAEKLAEDDEDLTKILKQDYLLQGPEIGARKSAPEPRFTYVRAPEKPNGHRLAACEAFQAEVVQFFIGRREQRSQPVRTSVYELIYGRGPSAIFSPPPTSPDVSAPGGSRANKTYQGKPTFTWYHLPANNKTWVNDLIMRLLSERRPESATPDENFKSRMGLRSVKGRSTPPRTVAFSYMRPFSKTFKADTSISWDGEKTEQAMSFVPFLNYEISASYNEMMICLNRIKNLTPVARAVSSISMPPPPPLPISDPFYPNRPRMPPPAPLAIPPHPRFNTTAPTGLANLNIRGGSGPPSPTQESRPAKGSQNRILSLFSASKPLKPPKKKAKKTPGFLSGSEFENPHALLIRGYGVPERDGQVPFQPRRTLDQYFYSHLDNTAHRDTDQVVYRYTRNQGGKMFMVDQMWLWIINGDTLITCIPHPWREGSTTLPHDLATATAEDLVRGPSIERPRPPNVANEPSMTPAVGGTNLAPGTSEYTQYHDHLGSIDENDTHPDPPVIRVSPPPAALGGPRKKPPTAEYPMSIQHRVLRHLKEISRDPIESIYDLTGLIASCCASSFDENQIPDDMQFFDFFERSIGIVIDKATNCLHEFKTGLRYKRARQSEPNIPNGRLWIGDESMDEDLNIATEIDLLVEIEDIQDELHILRVVLRDQKRTLRQLDVILMQGRKRHGPARTESELDSMIDASCIEQHTARITEMEQLAEKAHKSLYHLIDLKQKQANFSEAFSARKLARETAENTQVQIMQSGEMSRQAEETARQGKTLMVFTVVTIVFLPLSFMAAFFAINIDIFPVNQDGKIELGYVLKYMLSISVALAIPFVLLALRIDDVKKVSHGFYRALRRALVSPLLLPVTAFVILSLLVVVVIPAVVWASKLAADVKVATTVVLGVIALLGLVGFLTKLCVLALQRMELDDTSSLSSYFSESGELGGSEL